MACWWGTRGAKRKKGCVRCVMGQQWCLPPISWLWRCPRPGWCPDCSVCPGLWSDDHWDICRLQEFDRLVPRSAGVGVEGEEQWTETTSLWDTNADRPGLLLHHLRPTICQDSDSGTERLIVSGVAHGLKERTGIYFVTGGLPAQIMWCVMGLGAYEQGTQPHCYPGTEKKCYHKLVSTQI